MKPICYDSGGHVEPDKKSVILNNLGDAAGHGAGHNNVGDAGVGHGHIC